MRETVRPGAISILVVLAALACAAGPAAAATRTVTVPLDRSGKVAGSIKLRVLTLPARSAKPKGTLLVLAGGPGDGNVEYFTRRRDVLDTVRADWDVVTFDQRGTGRSGRLSCPEYESGEDPATSVPKCAARLGAAANLYTSTASADDIDAVRAALGVKKISLYGLSYGTWVAQTYAKRHRANLDRLVLDGIVARAFQSDPFSLLLFDALPGVMRASCQGGACKGITSDPYADLVSLARKLNTAPLEGTRVDDQGRPQKQQVIFPLAAFTVSEADVNVDLRRQLPGAMRRAVDGDPTLLLRLVEVANIAPRSGPDRFSTTLNMVTQCEETQQPWARTTPPAERLAEATRRLEQIPPARFAPVDRALIPALNGFDRCAAWPNLPADPDDARPMPRLPTLILNGDADLRTPLLGAKELAKSLPGSRLVSVPNVGHNTLSSALTDCARRALADFIGGGAAKSCGGTRFEAAVPPPATLGSSAAARVAAAVMTADDAVAQVRMRIRALQDDTLTARAGGLLGGVVSGDVKRVTLTNAELVKGLMVSGTLTADGNGRITVAGAVSGTLTLTARRVTGTLGGAAVDAARPDAGYL
jgi:pimeloyl-ACP methyl ester carboxylesterase